MDQIINVEKERKILDSRPYRFYSMYYNVTSWATPTLWKNVATCKIPKY